MNLSPLNLSGMLARDRGVSADSTAVKNERKSAREIVTWACPICRNAFDEDEEKKAEECCQGKACDEENNSCPVCDKSYINHREAADCCLWKDIDAPTRYKMADAVEAGSSWSQELGVRA